MKDRKAEVRRAIESVVSQSHRHLEIIVVENNSDDPRGVKEVVDAFSDPRIKFYSMEMCSNANSARNYGVSRSTGQYICFLDSDDEWMSDHIENGLKTIASHDADFVYGGAIINDGRKKVRREAWAIKNNAVNYLLDHENGFAPTPSFFVKRAVFDRVLWDETLYRHQDFDFFIRCSLLFKFSVNVAQDVIINWKAGELRAFDAKSMLDFYFKWRDDMTAATERRYLKGAVKSSLLNRAYRVAFRFLCYYAFAPLRRF